MIEKIKAADIIAILLVAGYLFLLYTGDGKDLMPTILLVLGYYFGHSAGTTQQNV